MVEHCKGGCMLTSVYAIHNKIDTLKNLCYSTFIMKTNIDTNTRSDEALEAVSPEFIVRQLGQDVRNSVLVVSLLANAFILIAWLVIETTTRYNPALISYLQSR